MPSTFTWLDHSETDRQKALDVIDLFRERDTRDELGIGAVRDAFSDLLFPGTSTIQTGARYFLFIPWIYLDLERLGVPSSDVARRARNEELRLIEPLKRSQDPAGTFGIEAASALKRLPSSVYWLGLKVWGVRLFEGSQHQYQRSLNGYYALRRLERPDEEHQPPVPPNWHPGMPAAPADFPNEASFALRRREAEYLRDRMLERVPGTYLAHLLDNGRSFTRCEFPWQHPREGDLPLRVREQLMHGRNFSDVSLILWN